MIRELEPIDSARNAQWVDTIAIYLYPSLYLSVSNLPALPTTYRLKIMPHPTFVIPQPLA